MKKFYGVIVYHYAAIIHWLLDCFATRGVVSEETYYRVLSYVAGKMEHAVLGLMKRTDYKRFHASIIRNRTTLRIICRSALVLGKIGLTTQPIALKNSSPHWILWTTKTLRISSRKSSLRSRRFPISSVSVNSNSI